MRVIKIFIVLMLLTVGSYSLHAQTCMYGGTGLLRIQSAETLTPGQMALSLHFLTFAEEKEASVLAKDVTFNAGLTFAISKMFEVTAGIDIYQDDNIRLVPMPGDTRLGLKVNMLRGTIFRVGVLPFFKLPTGDVENIRYEPYSSKKTGWGILGLSTIDLREQLPFLPIKLYFNFGYMDHDMSDLYFQSKTDQGLYGIGIKIPIKTAVLFTEYTSEVFINQPGLEYKDNSQRLTQALRFLGPLGLVFDAGFDIDLSRSPSSEYEEGNDLFHKDYADWKIFVGITKRFTLFPWLDKETRQARQRVLEEKRRKERLRKERENVAKDLEKMKKDLE